MVKYLIYDTETTGLNIITDKPFLFQYGLVDDKLNLIKVVVFEHTDLVERAKFEHYLKTVPTLVGHNIKFDIHMAINAGFDISIFENKNYIDTSTLARLVIDHDKQSDGSFAISLEKLAARYLGINSADEGKKLREKLSRLVLAHKNGMREYFIKNNLWDTALNIRESTAELNRVYNNWHKLFHLYPHLEQARKDYLSLHPEPTYADVSNVKTYGKTDILLTHGLFKLWYKDIVQLQQVPTLKRISDATFPLMLMERQGMVVDVPLLMRNRNAIVAEMDRIKIIDPRDGVELSVGQHAKLKEVYEYECGFNVESADKHTRDSIENYSPTAKTVSYLAKMAKYLNTYISGILNKIVNVDGDYKVFTQYNMAGTITGRLSSDFQQFPKDPLVLDDGSVIDIRAWFIVPKNDKYMFYFDYSQMELKLQCEWTNVILGKPDFNMARAFMPYECVQLGDKYYLKEDQTIEWIPTDLHGMTAKHAFPSAKETDADWDHIRTLGKRANFAINYGAGAPKLVEALKVDFSTAKRLIEGYKKTFAGVVKFGNWIYNRVYSYTNIPNLMLRRYYSRNKHQLQNWLVQGSGADILLLKLREVYEYIKDKPHWKFMITVHDEIGFVCGDIPQTQLVQEVQDIQNIMSHQLSAVNITCDIDYTITNWSDAKAWKG